MFNSTGDAMDGVYDKMWDVTVLEYAVSMHTRRGDQSRKKLALEKVNKIFWIGLVYSVTPT